MAVSGWPDFANANLADWEPVGALLDAIRERADVLRCVHLASRNAQNSVPANLVPEARPLDAPAVAVLEGIRTAVCRLAAFYVDPDNEDWRNAGCATDVAAFGSDAPVRVGAAHSLAALPRVAECEADPDALAEYRAFLANAAWWLDAFRYVDASERAAFAALLEASVLSDFDSPDVTRPTDGYALRTINRYGYPARLRQAASERLTSRVERNDEPYPVGYSHSPHESSWTPGTREVTVDATADFYDELSVVNPAPIAADVCLLPIQAEPSRNTDTTMTGAIRFVDFGGGQGHFLLASYTRRQLFEQWYGDGFKPSLDWVYSATRKGDEQATVADADYTETETVWHNSPDGTVRVPEAVTESGEGEMRENCQYAEAHDERYMSLFDAFGTGAALGVPLATGAVAPPRARVAVAAWSHSGSIPLADGWADRPTDSPALSVPGPQRRTFVYDLNANLGLAVLFDFGPHFQHGGIS